MVRKRQRTSTEPPAPPQLLAAIRSLSRPLRGAADLDPLLDRIADAHYVLLGEASHGTHEFYTWRTALSRRLIEEKGFSFIAVEGDWPDCYRLNRYLKGYPDADESARDVLHGFERWPTWMWANEEVAELAEWLRLHNDRLQRPRKVGFYGLDVYSLWDSLYQVLGYLGKHAPAALPAARRAFQCFEPFGEDVQEYAQATRWVEASCEGEVIALLAELRHLVRSHPSDGRDAQFNAEQNALVVKDAEHYYRTMMHGGPKSWNIRDGHMAETLERLMHHHGAQAKGIVWAHNTHVGDARFTDMADEGMVNLGQFVREKHAAQGVMLIGFGSYRGSVIAGQEWEAPMERMKVPPGRRDSWEEILYRVGAENRLLLLDEARTNEDFLKERGHRAIGVVYHPDYERYGNYVPTVLPLRYDAFLFLKETQALQPLQDVAVREKGEVPETYPSGV
jgi:erythromycin esterase